MTDCLIQADDIAQNHRSVVLLHVQTICFSTKIRKQMLLFFYACMLFVPELSECMYECPKNYYERLNFVCVAKFNPRQQHAGDCPFP